MDAQAAINRCRDSGSDEALGFDTPADADAGLAPSRRDGPAVRQTRNSRRRRPSTASAASAQTCFGATAGRTCVFPGLCAQQGRGSRALQCAESAHALVGVLAASPLTVGSKQKSAALRADFSFVAETGLVATLPLPVSASTKRKPDRWRAEARRDRLVEWGTGTHRTPRPARGSQTEFSISRVCKRRVPGRSSARALTR